MINRVINMSLVYSASNPTLTKMEQNSYVSSIGEDICWTGGCLMPLLKQQRFLLAAWILETIQSSAIILWSFLLKSIRRKIKWYIPPEWYVLQWNLQLVLKSLVEICYVSLGSFFLKTFSFVTPNPHQTHQIFLCVFYCDMVGKALSWLCECIS